MDHICNVDSGQEVHARIIMDEMVDLVNAEHFCGEEGGRHGAASPRLCFARKRVRAACVPATSPESMERRRLLRPYPFPYVATVHSSESGTALHQDVDSTCKAHCEPVTRESLKYYRPVETIPARPSELYRPSSCQHPSGSSIWPFAQPQVNNPVEDGV